ncbi:CPBP family intramembrane glutamic endopeptidase [Alkaliphilus sp. B6464]|uniref:CPBP family intramembrane glutamic endopeptidase n=1 Tax=Alkaliphilus sp. B6464 TaxID=2731219 RepID=UPI001BA489C5|nr:CPBP family intramembrane glutamic endopeptidase [Alkaliphilus sp. B6464]QUH18784.1 CPBP family intramembrane metalloprotease [Alkaliphilus sp. B6464]
MIIFIVITDKIKNYNWKLNFHLFLFIFIISIIIGISIVIPRYFLFRDIYLSKIAIKSVLFIFIHPALSEEVLFRGFLIHGLNSLNLNITYVNMIQSILFGLMHLNLYKDFGWWSLLMVSIQTLSGFLYGSLYLKSKSLTACVLLHGFCDLIGLSISYV